MKKNDLLYNCGVAGIGDETAIQESMETDGSHGFKWHASREGVWKADSTHILTLPDGRKAEASVKPDPKVSPTACRLKIYLAGTQISTPLLSRSGDNAEVLDTGSIHSARYTLRSRLENAILEPNKYWRFGI